MGNVNRAYEPDVPDDLDSDFVERYDPVMKELKEVQQQKGFFQKYFSCCFHSNCCKSSNDTNY